MQDKILVKESLHCGSPIETTYYSGKSPIFDNICFNGGDTEITRNRKIWQLGEEYGIVRQSDKPAIPLAKNQPLDVPKNLKNVAAHDSYTKCSET
uniref:Uncharacterized protein n=1 Tax=Magallana gigas TaxID=29159 RepID=A0A8W8N1N5_MAGGI